MARKTYKIFVRRWWKDDPKNPGELIPHPTARKTTLGYAETIEEARAICEEWNSKNKPGKYSRKAEFTSHY